MEIRWIKRRVKNDWGNTSEEVVLQYRNMIDIYEDGSGFKSWSEWKDVPIEE